MNSASVQKICIPIRESSAEKLEAAIASAEARAGFLELRLDYLEPAALTASNLRKWIVSASVPVIATCRRKANGGEFPGSEAEQMQVIQAALKAKVAFVDLEIETIEGFLQGRLDSLKAGVAASLSPTITLRGRLPICDRHTNDCKSHAPMCSKSPLWRDPSRTTTVSSN